MFCLGDRVWTPSDEEATVFALEGDDVLVEYDDGDSDWFYDEELELVTF